MFPEPAVIGGASCTAHCFNTRFDRLNIVMGVT